MHSIQNFEKVKKNLFQKSRSFFKNLRIADLELFITAAHLKNLGKAAMIHNLSQSAASSAIQRVEASLGISLCAHEKRKFSLTREGKILLPGLKNWLKQLNELIIPKENIPIRFITTHSIAQLITASLLEMDNIEIGCMRPDQAYEAVVLGKADLAIVLDNASWKGINKKEIGKGSFQLYSRNKNIPIKSVLLPENQLEELFLQQSWQQKYNDVLPIKARIASWSLIADICANSDAVGFLPDFLAEKHFLSPVSWQPDICQYRILAIYKDVDQQLQNRLDLILEKLKYLFASSSNKKAL